MANFITVRDDRRGVRLGAITFGETVDRLAARRTAAGFELEFPVTVVLERGVSTDPQPLLTDLSAQFAAINDRRWTLPLGRAQQRGWFVAAIPQSSTTSALVWEGPLGALAAYEQFRDVQRPTFRFTLLAQLSYLLPSAAHNVRTEPQQVYGEVEVSYPTEVWLRAVRDVGVAQTIFLEVPLSSSPPSPWDAVWRSVAEAAVTFERGGETGRRGAILAVRQALDAWRSIEGEAEDPGPEWSPAKREEREARTPRQRLDAIRWHLREYAHLAAHTEAKNWTREDAVLLLSTLSALLAIRRP